MPNFMARVLIHSVEQHLHEKLNEKLLSLQSPTESQIDLLTGWNPVADYNRSRTPHRKKLKKQQILTINISGQRFHVWSDTFDSFPDTLLGNHEGRAHFFDKNRGEYFFDRDPEIFRHILTYYRSGKLHYPRTECIGAVDDELAYFGISQDLIADCCYEDYRDRKREYSAVF